MSYQSAPDGFSLKYTGAYRDPETYLDFLNARYYSPQQGRFVSPDPENAGADATDPTTWNGYAYVSNNPLNLTDPSGQGILGWLWGLVGLIGGGPIGGAIGLGLGEAADLTFNTENPLPSWAMLLIGGISLDPLSGIGLEGSIIGSVAAVNSGPWNEQPPIGGGMGPLNTGTVFGSGDTGPFINNYNSYEHIKMTTAAGGDFWFAMGVAGVDLWGRSQATDWHSHWHAMGGLVMNRTLRSWRKPTYHQESPCAAYAGTVSAVGEATGRALAGDRSAAELAVHIIQDSYAGGHQYQGWPGGLPSWSHQKADAAYSQAPVEATRQYLQALHGNAPMLSPGSYLYPGPAGCR